MLRLPPKEPPRVPFSVYLTPSEKEWAEGQATTAGVSSSRYIAWLVECEYENWKKQQKKKSKQEPTRSVRVVGFGESDTGITSDALDEYY